MARLDHKCPHPAGPHPCYVQRNQRTTELRPCSFPHRLCLRRTPKATATWRSWPSDKDNMGCEWASSTWTKSHHSKVLFRLVLLSWSHWAGRLNHCHFAAFGPYVTWKFQHHQLTFFEIFENIPQPTNPWILSMGASPPTPTIPTPPDRTKIFLFTLDNRSCTSANAGSFFLASPDAQRDWLGQPAHEELFPACSPWVSAACFFLCFLWCFFLLQWSCNVVG